MARFERSEPSEQQLAVGEAEAARMLNLSARTLWSLRQSGDGPKFRRANRRVLYAVEDLKAWLATPEQGRSA